MHIPGGLLEVLQVFGVVVYEDELVIDALFASFLAENGYPVIIDNRLCGSGKKTVLLAACADSAENGWAMDELAAHYKVPSASNI